ncbi:hypothetical protein AGLY_003359 [Aphis glycines]|uniref:DUF659 domain-containing protein n=1 Tax=Aphis glycines TaxID=307491 RepID=A0A6G0U058_APHGL|nr:hypothetical protein AGLY_003359 [Aphis glycines]
MCLYEFTQWYELKAEKPKRETRDFHEIKSSFANKTVTKYLVKRAKPYVISRAGISMHFALFSKAYCAMLILSQICFIIRKFIQKNKNIWVSIDETTDANGRYVANVIIGTLEVGNIEVLEKTNHSTIAKVLDKSLSILWPQGIIHDNVLLFLSDAAPYMVKAATSIQTYYSKMIHVTCLAHALHRVAEEIRIHFPNVDELINNVKKVFLKAPSRIQIFKTMAPDIPLPPRPVLTRWGTWLNASMYYCDHFELIKEIINQLDGEDAVAVSKAQNLFSNANFSTLATSITQLETSGVPLIDSINIIQKIKAEIQKAPNQIGKIIYQKLSTTLNKNKGFKIISDISDILNGQGTTNEIPDDLTANDLAFFKYSPITSVDVERSFSIYKNLLADNRRSFLFENLKQALVVQLNEVHVYEIKFIALLLGHFSGTFFGVFEGIKIPALVISHYNFKPWRSTDELLNGCETYQSSFMIKKDDLPDAVPYFEKITNREIMLEQMA